LNGGGFSRTGWSDNGDIGTRLDSDGKFTEDTDTRTSGVAEVDAFEANASDNILRDETLSRGCINIGLRIQEFENINSGTTGR
jgi:hypothetical protein